MSLSVHALTLMVSPGVCIATAVRSMASRSTLMRHGVGADAVSGGTTVSHSSTTTSASASLTSLTSAVPDRRSMPRL